MSKQGQKKKNLKLLILLGLSISVTVITAAIFNESTDSLGIDRTTYSIQNTMNIDRVLAKEGSEGDELAFKDGKWYLNKQFPANPLNIKLLFATIQQINIRREMGDLLYDSLSREFENRGKAISFYEGDQLVKELTLLGYSKEEVTYLKDEDKIYLLEIPGYRPYIYGLLAVSDPEWRHPNIFNEFVWRNLKEIEVRFAANGLEKLHFMQNEDFYKLEGTVQTDTAKLIDFIDYISLLEVDGFIEKPDSSNWKPFMEIEVFDVGMNSIKSKFWRDSIDGSFTGLRNGKSFFKIYEDKIRPMVKQKEFFEK